MFVRRNEKSRRAAGRIENLLVLFGVEDLHHEVDDVAGRAELTRVALGAQH